MMDTTFTPTDSLGLLTNMGKQDPPAINRIEQPIGKFFAYEDDKEDDSTESSVSSFSTAHDEGARVFEVLRAAKHNNRSRERVAPQRSRSLEGLPIRRSIPEPQNFQDVSIRSYEGPRTTESLDFAPLLKRSDNKSSILGIRDGGKSFFLNMMTASSSSAGSSSFAINLNKSIGLGESFQREHSHSIDPIRPDPGLKEAIGLGPLKTLRRAVSADQAPCYPRRGGAHTQRNDGSNDDDSALMTNRKWRACLHRSRSLRMVSFHHAKKKQNSTATT